MNYFWEVVVRNVAAALVGIIIVSGKKFIKDLNAFFKKSRQFDDKMKAMEERISQLERANDGK